MLFKKKGFRETTLNAIAAHAGTGVATIYKHFKSKEDILYELLVPELEECFDNADAIIANPPSDPVDALNALIECFFSLGQNTFERSHFAPISVPGSSGTWDTLDEVGEETDIYAEQLVRDLLLIFQARGSIPGSLDVNQMATIIYGIFNQKYIEYLTHENTSKEQAISELNQLIALLFADWRNP